MRTITNLIATGMLLFFTTLSANTTCVVSTDCSSGQRCVGACPSENDCSGVCVPDYSWEVLTPLQSAPNINNINLVFIADTTWPPSEETMTAYTDKVNELLDVFTYSPWKEYQPVFNVFVIKSILPSTFFCSGYCRQTAIDFPSLSSISKWVEDQFGIYPANGGTIPILIHPMESLPFTEAQVVILGTYEDIGAASLSHELGHAIGYLTDTYTSLGLTSPLTQNPTGTYANIYCPDPGTNIEGMTLEQVMGTWHYSLDRFNANKWAWWSRWSSYHYLVDSTPVPIVTTTERIDPLLKDYWQRNVVGFWLAHRHLEKDGVSYPCYQPRLRSIMDSTSQGGTVFDLPSLSIIRKEILRRSFPFGIATPGVKTTEVFGNDGKSRDEYSYDPSTNEYKYILTVDLQDSYKDLDWRKSAIWYLDTGMVDSTFIDEIGFNNDGQATINLQNYPLLDVMSVTSNGIFSVAVQIADYGYGKDWYYPDENDPNGDGKTVYPGKEKRMDTIVWNITVPPDMDNDGISNETDNCPFIPTANQFDWNDNGKGDACDDYDGDGITDAEDNCPRKANPYEAVPPYQEMISALCDNPDGDGTCTANGGAQVLMKTKNHGFLGYEQFKTTWGSFNINSKKVTYSDLYLSILSYYWQPDQDLDGVGDACDDQSFADGGFATADIVTSQINSSYPVYQETPPLIRYKTNYNALIGLELSTHAQGIIYNIYNTVMFCGMDQTEKIDPVFGTNNWGKDGFCTTSDRVENGTGNGLRYGYSHATDPTPKTPTGDNAWNAVATTKDKTAAFGIPFTQAGIEQYRKPIYLMGNVAPDEITLLKTNAYWNWRADTYIDAKCQQSPTKPICARLSTPNNIDEGQLWQFYYYTLSSGVKGTADNYLNTDNTINSSFFKNSAKFARAKRTSIGANFISYSTNNQFSILEPKIQSPSVTEHSLMPFSGVLEQPLMVNLWRAPNGILTVQPKELPVGTRQIVSDVQGLMLAFVKENLSDTGLYISYPGEQSNWTRIAAVGGYPEDLRDRSGAYFNDTLYIAGIDSYGTQVYKMVKEGTEYRLIRTGFTIPILTEMRLVALESGLTVIGNATDSLSVYKLDEESGAILAATTARRFDFSLASFADELYITGGKDINNVMLADTLTYRPTIGTIIPFKTIPGLVANTLNPASMVRDGKLLVLQPADISGTTGTLHTISLATAQIETAPIEIAGLLSTENLYTRFCLGEDQSQLFAGIATNESCTPFTHPWYKQYSIGTTVYSVAGKGDRLYVGTGSSIKVYDISDPNALALKSTFTTNKTVYDLEPADGDIMYAATSGGIYKLNTVNPDTLSQISFYSTPYNYQYRIQLYNDKLYVGDDNGINIRNKDNFARLAYVNIGSTMDFAIANGELAMYWDDFWDSGIDIRDADTLTRKAWDYGYCSTGELTTDHGAFYLSCDGYEYRFIGLPNTYLDFFELNGDMREMQENYLYNGWVYIPDGNKVKLSTNNEVPSICGNGIIEPGEFCDGNSVDCWDLDPNQWDSGTATCNSTCTAWDTGDCYWSGC